MPRTGKAFSVRMSNCGPLGWVSDRERGYRYQATHPQTGAPWPAFPPETLAAWQDLGCYPHEPEACLINYYASGARMSLHQVGGEARLAFHGVDRIFRARLPEGGRFNLTLRRVTGPRIADLPVRT